MIEMLLDVGIGFVFGAIAIAIIAARQANRDRAFYQHEVHFMARENAELLRQLAEKRERQYGADDADWWKA